MVKNPCINPTTGKNVNFNSKFVECDNPNCRKKFWKKQGDINRTRHNYCSQNCQKIYGGLLRRKKIEVFCINNCGRKKMVAPSVYKKNKIFKDQKIFFCSRTCESRWKKNNLIGKNCPNWKGGYEKYYGESWHECRRKSRQRDLNICQSCGKSKDENGKNLDVNHIVRFTLFTLNNEHFANILANTVCYCKNCHKSKDVLLQSVPFLLPTLILSNAIFAPEPYNSEEEIKKTYKTIDFILKNPQNFNLNFSPKNS